ncbi:MAG: calycin-like domain-containing protein [Mediterranea sp.]|jgi:hypothetical protein|nr:calycin-like domain-containing protein [Mediterranea sp.]
MKIKYLFLMIVAGLFAASCDGDDNITPSQAVADTYNGYTWTSFFNGAYTQLSENETVSVTANEDGTITVTYTSSTWGTSTISAATVIAGTNSYTISGTGTSAITSHSTGTVNNYDCTLTGTISTDKSDVEFVFTLPAVMQGTTITFHKGDAPDHMVVAGSYSSYSTASFTHGSMVSNNESITLKANTENGTVDLAYSGTWGTGTATGLEVSKNNGSYTVNGSGTTVVSGHSGSASNYAFTVEGAISEDKSTASFVLTIEMGAMGTVTVTTGLGYASPALFLPDTYNGYTDMDSGYFKDRITADQAITITGNEDGTVNVAYGDNTISKVEAKVNAEGIYTLSGQGVYAISMSGPPSNYDCTLTGTINADKSEVEIIFTLPAVMQGTTITFHKGDAPVTTE